MNTSALPREVLDRFDECMADATKAGEPEPTAMCLSTVSDTGVSSRMVLLKQHDQSGFVFYTNLDSIKGRQLSSNPAAALVFHWKSIEQQVRVEGVVIPVTEEEANTYFASRDRGSQLGAWASQQSKPMSGRMELVKRVAATEAKYLTQAVPRPPFWSGFRVMPAMIEFWYGRTSRLHDRYRYTHGEDGWAKERLFP